MEKCQSASNQTYCIIAVNNTYSDSFQTFSGIRQGAPSSTYLFLIFIDDLIQYIESNCEIEPIIGNLSCLLHADDTAIISTKRSLFILKCNTMLNYFQQNSLNLNLDKSSYLIINPKESDFRYMLTLNNGPLKYSSKIFS